MTDNVNGGLVDPFSDDYMNCQLSSSDFTKLVQQIEGGIEPNHEQVRLLINTCRYHFEYVKHSNEDAQWRIDQITDIAGEALNAK